jgi:pyruvate dehydrogenase (quinone)
MAKTIADVMVTTLKASGVRRVYGIPGDTVNGFMDALRRDGEITWEHVRHEEAAGFAAAAEAAVTGQLAVCAGSCGPGNLHLINGLFDANRSRCRCWRSPRRSRGRRSAGTTSRRLV